MSVNNFTEPTPRSTATPTTLAASPAPWRFIDDSEQNDEEDEATTPKPPSDEAATPKSPPNKATTPKPPSNKATTPKPPSDKATTPKPPSCNHPGNKNVDYDFLICKPICDLIIKMTISSSKHMHMSLNWFYLYTLMLYKSILTCINII